MTDLSALSAPSVPGAAAHGPLFAQASGQLSISFEFFPPRTAAMSDQLWQAIEALAPLRPAFVSVTYGAGGSTRERTHAVVRRILAETPLVPAAHLTCVGASRAEVDAVAQDYWDAGVRHLVALRGDPTEPGGRFAPHPDGYANAAELVAGLQRIGAFDISVAAYPDVHPEATSAGADFDHLLRKVDAGAQRAITQFFFEPDNFLRLRDRLAVARPHVELVPGILPVTNVAQARRFASQCGAPMPDWLDALFEGLDEQPGARQLVAATVAAELAGRLRAEGVRNFHFYTLNRAELSYAICRLLGVRT